MDALSDVFTTVLMTILLIFLALPIVVIVFGLPLIDLMDAIFLPRIKADFDRIGEGLAACEARWAEVERKKAVINAEYKQKKRAEKRRQAKFKRDCIISGYPGSGYRRIRG